ncbi:hypothetical protein C0993_002009 [Termitomyces sp. T159_Od127]|nr:hypothetical protein C0993_002009 [Termitomyces sp. T159_Od127]
MQNIKQLLIDDKGVVFEGHDGVTPIDDMRQQFVVHTGELDQDPGSSEPGPPQIGAKPTWEPPEKVNAQKPTMKADLEQSWVVKSHSANCGHSDYFAKDCYAPPKARVRAMHTAAAPSEHDIVSDIKEDPEELVKNEQEDHAGKEHSVVSSVKSVMIDGDKYIAVDIYDNDYYVQKDEEEHLFALINRPDDKHIHMRHITLQKAADKLQRPKYTPQEKECLVTYVDVNGHAAWTLWDSGSTTTGITPQFAHVDAICLHRLKEPLMLHLGMVSSCAMVQFGVEVKVRMSGTSMKEYVDIANFDCYDMIISMPFMCKNKFVLDFVNDVIVVNGVPVRGVVLEDTDGCLQWHCVMENHHNGENHK